jgi:hypothetical protein
MGDNWSVRQIKTDWLVSEVTEGSNKGKIKSDLIVWLPHKLYITVLWTFIQYVSASVDLHIDNSYKKIVFTPIYKIYTWKNRKK